MLTSMWIVELRSVLNVEVQIRIFMVNTLFVKNAEQLGIIKLNDQCFI